MSTAEFGITSKKRTQFLSLSAKIADIVTANGWQDGLLTVFIPHTTAGVTINESADPDVARDMETFSDQLVPKSSRFLHSEGNSDAHIKASFFGSSVQVLLRSGRIWLGTWQGIYFCEFDGPRERMVRLMFIHS